MPAVTEQALLQDGNLVSKYKNYKHKLQTTAPELTRYQHKLIKSNKIYAISKPFLLRNSGRKALVTRTTPS